MPKPSSSPASRRVIRVVAMAALVLTALSAVACRSNSRAILEESPIPVETGTVQASMPVSVPTTQSPATNPTGTAGASNGGGSTQATSSSGAVNAALQNKSNSAPVGIWPAKVGTFALNFKGPVWYPKIVPTGYKVDSLDVVEFDPGSGLVCDIVWVSGDKSVEFMQGSPKTRDYAIVSIGKVPWGTQTANIVHQDPTDNTTPITIVYSKGGNFAELSGDVSTAELKAMAASMVAVK